MKFCIMASGPSLTADDVKLVQQSGIKTIVTNSTWQAAPWADHIFAADCEWWDKHREAVPAGPRRWTSSKSAANRYRDLCLFEFRIGGNSGAQAIRLAMNLGATEIILLGFDCSVKNGTHWHGDHTLTKNPDENRCKVWLRQFHDIPRGMCRIINCSRETEITAFPRMTLEAALNVAA